MNDEVCPLQCLLCSAAVCERLRSNALIFLFFGACVMVMRSSHGQCISLASGETYLMTFWWYAASASEGETGSILPQTVRSEFLYYTNSADTVRETVSRS